MTSKTTDLIMKRFGCLRCQYFRAAGFGRGSKAKCAYVQSNERAIRYLKRCPKR